MKPTRAPILWLLSLTLLSSPLLHAETTLFRLDGIDYNREELSPDLQQQLYALDQERYTKRKELLEQTILELYLAEQADKRSSTPDAMMAEFSAASRPSEQQVDEFYNSNKACITGTLAQVKPQIVQYLQEQEINGRKSRLLARLEGEKRLKMSERAPTPPMVSINTLDYPAKGKLDSSVVVVEFADYQCPHCRHAHDAMRDLWPQYQDQIKLVYMDFPINRSGISRAVSEGAVCADQQGKFWPYNELAFDQQEGLSKSSPLTLAQQLSLDITQFTNCLTSPATVAKVKSSEDEARRLGIDSTPTIFVNGSRVAVEDFHKDLKASFERALKSAM